MSPFCSICGEASVDPLVAFGSQPLSNRFPMKGEPDDLRVPFGFGCCRHCGVARFLNPPSPELIKPEVDWIRYHEPEGHLDDLVTRLIGQKGVHTGSHFFGISYKEESTLRRLNELGYSNTSLLDLGISDPCAGIETIQKALRVDRVEKNCADVIIVRHVLEHAQDTQQAVAALNHMLRPGGTIVYEVPDNTRVFENRELCFLWEEHVLYFLPETFQQALGLLGYQVNWMTSYAYPVENSLVAFVTPGGTGTCLPNIASKAYAAAQQFVSGLGVDRESLRGTLAKRKAEGQTLVGFGSGHLATKFLNFYDIAEFLSFMVDDHPGKQGRVMAGSGLPILPSSVLHDAIPDLLLMSLNPESEERVMEKLSGKLKGCEFASMFRSSPRAIQETT